MTFRLYVAGLWLVVACVVGGSGCSSQQNSQNNPQQNEQQKVAFVTNQIASFWNIAEVGAMDAGKDFDVDVTVIMPRSPRQSSKSGWLRMC